MDSIRLLHIDDEEVTLLITRKFLKKLDKNLNVTSMTSPKEAINALAENRYDCIISDYAMNDLNGIELARRVKNFLNVPFILYTGKGSEEVAQQAFRSGIDDYVRKDFEPSHYEVLLNSIKRAIQRHRAEQIYKAVFESNLDGIWVTIDDRIVYANDVAASICGVDNAQSLIDMTAIDFLVESDAEDLKWLTLRHSTFSDSSFQFQLKLRRPDNAVRIIEGYKNRVMYFGKPAFVFFFRDITDKLGAFNKLELSQFFFDKIFLSSLIGIGVVRDDGSVFKANEAFLKIFGMKNCGDACNMDYLDLGCKASALLPGESLYHEGCVSISKSRSFEPSAEKRTVEVELVLSRINLDEGDEGFLVQVHPLG